MKNFTSIIAFGSAVMLGAPAIAQPIDVAGFLKERGATAAELRPIAHSPDPAIKLVSLFEKHNNTPSCGILIAAPRPAKPRYIELVGADPDAGFPQCIGIPSITSFRLQGRHYFAIEYLHRETREDTYRSFHYLYDEPGQGFVSDKILEESVAPTEWHMGGASASVDGIKLARAAVMKKTFPQWRFLERDFIADSTSAFATFEDGKSHTCHFVVEAGARPVTANLADLASASACERVLAATRLDTPAATYYLAMFKSDQDRQLVGIASVARDGAVRVEKELSANINRAGATRDIKTARAALSASLTPARR